jgi:uncharacterized protein
MAFIIPDDDNAAHIEAIVQRSVDSREPAPIIIRQAVTTSCIDLSKSNWMLEHFSDLDKSMRRAFALGLMNVQPFSLMSQIGIVFFPLHPSQHAVPIEKLTETINRIVTEKRLADGMVITEADSAALALLPAITGDIAEALLNGGHKKSIATKNDLLKIPGMTAAMFRNIAGYILLPYAENPLDRTRVHPDHYAWVAEMCSVCATSIDGAIAAPEVLRTYQEQDSSRKFFIENRLMGQLAAGQRFAATSFNRHRRKLKLDELQEGIIVSGRITNITPFGVFVNINAVCEGLIHISQLADTYIETPEQVVSLNDMVNVRIIRIDPKKRRISLSMLGVTAQPVKIAPSKRQLNSLATHFQNR